MKISGLQKMTLLDFPGKVACTVFLQGCNFRCPFCHNSDLLGNDGPPSIPPEDLLAFLGKRVGLLDGVCVTGGEPTLREDLPLLVDHAKRFVTRLNTNGVNLTPELVKDLKAAGLDSVQVTLYSHDEAVHNELVGVPRFADTVQGIQNAVTAGLDISVNTPLCRKNRDYRKTLEFVHSLGVRFATVSGLICTGMADNNHEAYDLSEEELFAIVKEAKVFVDANGMEMDFTSPGLISKERLESLHMNIPMCGAALSNMAIAPDGTVVPCQSWLGSDAALGNILTDDFSRIWNHKACVSLRQMSEEAALSCPFRTGKGR